MVKMTFFVVQRVVISFYILFFTFVIPFYLGHPSGCAKAKSSIRLNPDSWSTTMHPAIGIHFVIFYFYFRARVAIPEVLRWTRGIRHVLGCDSELAGKTGPAARLRDDGQPWWVASFTHSETCEGISDLAECVMQLRKWNRSYNFLILLVSTVDLVCPLLQSSFGPTPDPAAQNGCYVITRINKNKSSN